MEHRWASYFHQNRQIIDEQEPNEGKMKHYEKQPELTKAKDFSSIRDSNLLPDEKQHKLLKISKGLIDEYLKN